MADILAPVDEEHASYGVDWRVLPNVFLKANWKGGVGKTTLAAHMGGRAAGHGRRTLVVDLNAQGNLALDLGVIDKPGIDDKGKGLFTAVTAGVPLVPAKDVRPNLDLIPGGEWIAKIPGHLQMEMTSREQAARAFLSLARALMPLAGNYDLIVIDSPPENEPLLMLALCAARFVITPMKTDEASRLGLRQFAKIFRKARQLNPHLRLVGVVLFATSSSAKRVHASIRQEIRKDLGEAVPVYDTFVRHAEALAVVARRNGLLFGELADQGRSNPAFWKGLREKPDKQSVAENLAGDIAKLVDEIFSSAKVARDKMVREGVWP